MHWSASGHLVVTRWSLGGQSVVSPLSGQLVCHLLISQWSVCVTVYITVSNYSVVTHWSLCGQSLMIQWSVRMVNHWSVSVSNWSVSGQSNGSLCNRQGSLSGHSLVSLWSVDASMTCCCSSTLRREFSIDAWS